MMRHKVLVTGASGFLGGRLAIRLQQDQVEYFVLARPGSSLPHVPESRVLVPQDSPSGVAELVRQLDPTTIYHCAGRVQTDHVDEDVNDLVASNIGLFSNLLQGASDLESVNFVNVGTYLQFRSDGSPSPNSLYAATKLSLDPIAKFYLSTSNMKMITIITSVLYGVGDPRPRLMNALAKSILSRQKLSLSPGQQKIDLIYVDDVVEALLTANLNLQNIKPGSHETYFALSDEKRSLRDIVSAFEKNSGSPIDVDWGGKPYKNTEVFNPYTEGERLPGWQPKVSLDEGINRLLSDIARQA